jgi:predicted DNA-binding transcriptional regulator YafY
VLDDDLHGVSFAIEYKDAHEEITTRRISIRRICASDDGRVYIQSLCHERKAFRSFRFDRIRSVIDMDGVVWPPKDFFSKELHVDLSAWKNWSAETPSPRRKSLGTGLAHRQIANDEVRVLTALARVDGFMDEKEVDAIITFVMAKADHAGIQENEKSRDALRASLRRQRPNIAAVEESLSRIEKEPVEEQRLFVKTAIRVMDADGVQDTQEFNMLMQILDHLTSVKGFR